jgi:multidrug resistance efflux pump
MRYPEADRIAELEQHAADLKQELAAARAEIERKDALIEQMREALRLANDLIDDYASDYEHRDNVDEVRDMINAALSAAERGGK